MFEMFPEVRGNQFFIASAVMDNAFSFCHHPLSALAIFVLWGKQSECTLRKLHLEIISRDQNAASKFKCSNYPAEIERVKFLAKAGVIPNNEATKTNYFKSKLENHAKIS